jgi:prepilin-type processing-associated H-X9-DG protein
MNFVSGGPSNADLAAISEGNGTAQVLLAWDHTNVPGCAYFQSGMERVPWPFDSPQAPTHYSPRHNGKFNALFCDGHVTPMTAGDLATSLFIAGQ